MLAKALGKKLNATVLFWDAYDGISESPKDYVEWHARKGCYVEWKYDALAELLCALKAGQTPLCPISGKKLKPTNLVIFDAPLGYCHQQTGQFIDRLIFLDTPLDVALARRILRDAQRLQEVFKDLKYYLEKSRPLFFGEELRRSADVIFDGSEQREMLIEKSLSFVNSFLQENAYYEVHTSPPKNFSPTISVSGCYCEFQNKILLLKRAPQKIQGNRWGVAAGKAENGETPLQTILREVKEEIDITLDENKICFLGTLYVVHPEIQYTYHMYCYRFESLPDLQLNLEENVEAVWTTLSGALQLPLVSAGSEALRFYEFNRPSSPSNGRTVIQC